jgi:hypothetical protein
MDRRLHLFPGQAAAILEFCRSAVKLTHPSITIDDH